VVRATDIAGNVSLTKMHVVLNVPLPAPLSLQITPANVSVVVGSSQPFTAVDDKGRPRTDASWTISNHTVATITSDASPWLTALAAGSATLTATVQGLSTQEQVTVLSGTASPGTASWTVPPIQTRATQLVSATPWIGGTPDLYDTEGSGSTAVLRAFTIDGRLLWQQSTTTGPLMSDAFGGLIGISNNGDLTDLDGQTGTPVWQYSPQGPLGGYGLFALRPDGSIFALETDAQDAQVHLDVFDGNSGARIMSVPIPQSHRSSHDEQHCTDLYGIPHVFITDSSTPVGPIAAGDPVVIDENGNAYVEYEVLNVFDSVVESTCNDDPAVAVETGTVTVGLLELSLDGSSSLQPVQSANWSRQLTYDVYGNSTEQDNGSVIGQGISIPDGTGGMLVGWVQEPVMTTTVGQPAVINWMITHTNGGPTFQIPLGGAPSQMVLGENGTAFASTGGSSGVPGIVSFDMNSGTVNWTYNAPTGYEPYIIASASGNGLAAQLLNISTGIGTVTRFDSSGRPTSDSWSAVEIRNFGGSQWLGISGGALTAIPAAPVELSTASYYAPDGNGGNAAKQTYSVSHFSQEGPNQTTAVGVVKEIFEALPLATFPGSGSCYSWLNAGQNNVSALQTFLTSTPSDWAHGTVNVDGKASYLTNAITEITSLTNLDTTVNDLGFFFNYQYPLGNNQFSALRVGPRGYVGNTLPAQAQISLHELGHQAQFTIPPNPPKLIWQQNDAGKSEDENRKAVEMNDLLVDRNCGQLIRALPSINPTNNVPPSMSVGLSPVAGSIGTQVTINGTNFGTSQGTSTVTFTTASGSVAAAASSWGTTQIRVTVPNGATTGNIVVTVSGVSATGPVFTVQ
jgi:hypothetical protein